MCVCVCVCVSYFLSPEPKVYAYTHETTGCFLRQCWRLLSMEKAGNDSMRNEIVHCNCICNRIFYVYELILAR